MQESSSSRDVLSAGMEDWEVDINQLDIESKLAQARPARWCNSTVHCMYVLVLAEMVYTARHRVQARTGARASLLLVAPQVVHCTARLRWCPL